MCVADHTLTWLAGRSLVGRRTPRVTRVSERVCMGKTGKFQYVYIPADVSEPLQELSLSYTEEDEVQCLLNRLRVSHSCVAPYSCVGPRACHQLNKLRRPGI